MVDTSDEWITRRTGMKQRHILKEGVPSYSMGVEAAGLAIEDGAYPMDTDLIIATTEALDFVTVNGLPDTKRFRRKRQQHLI